MDQLQYTLAPLKNFYLISTTSAALSDKLLSCWWYRLYIVIIFSIPFLAVAHTIYLTFDHIKVSPFNFNIVTIYYLILHYTLMMYPMLSAKRMRINKVVRALEDLDFKMHFKDFELCRKIRKGIVIWMTLLFTSHVVIHGALVFLLLQLPTGDNIVTVSMWFKLVEVVMDMELSWVGCFAWLLYYRARAFLRHLEAIIGHECSSSDLNLLLCHRQLHYVLKKINKAWKIQISVIMCIITFQVLRNLIVICINLNNKIKSFIGFILFVRYLTVFVPLCVVGQRLANVFDNIHVTAAVMRDSSHVLTGSYVRSGAHMCTEGALRVRRLHGWCELDAALPLRLLASIGSLLIVILQLRVGFNVFDI